MRTISKSLFGSMIISLKLTHVFRSKLTHPFTGGSVG